MSQTIITARVIDQTVQLSNLPLIASGSKGVLQIRCDFDSKWDGYGKTAVFYREQGPVYHIVIVNGIATIPKEVLADSGYFYFGIFGDADNTRTTEVVRLTVAQGAITEATATPEDPTPDIYSQIMAAYAEQCARIDELVAMRGSDGASEVSVQDEYITGTIKHNGVSAYADFTIKDLSLIAGGYHYSDYFLLPELAPLGPVEMKTTNPDLNITIEAAAPFNAGWARVLIENPSNSMYTTDMVTTATAFYPLARPYIPELGDMRVDALGRAWSTAGEAFRENTRPALHISVSTDAEGNHVASRDSLSIYEQACVEGRAVYLDWGPGIHIPLAYSTEDQARFEDTQVTESGLYTCQMLIGPDSRVLVQESNGSTIDDSKIVTDATWSSKNIVDKLCPAFTESGPVVTCEPVESYPLTVTAEQGAILITRCGKNLLSNVWKDLSNYKNNNRLILHLPKGKYVLSAEKNEGAATYLYLTKSIDGGTTWETFYRLHTNNSAALNTVSFEVTGAEGEMWALWTASQNYLNLIKWVQIEVGTTATDYEPYLGAEFNVGEPILAIEGINTLWADIGEITVSGKADPTAIIKKLTNAIIALGGNV